MLSKPLPNPIVVIPIHRLPLDADELRSLESVRRHLGDYLIDFIMPECLLLDKFVTQKNERVTRFPNRFFQSTDSYNGMLTSAWFYEQYANHSHLLICQLDSLVFKNELLEWCLEEWDYIGAPLLKYNGHPENDSDWIIGNGGFSLRKTKSFLRVLRSAAPKGIYFNAKTRTCDAPDFELGYSIDPLKYCFSLKQKTESYLTSWNVDQEVRGFRANEDIFWSSEAAKFYHKFRVAPFEEGRRFAWEKNPSTLYHKNGNKLPFGCHAWKKYATTFYP